MPRRLQQVQAAVVEEVEVAVELEPVESAGRHEVIEDERPAPIGIGPVRVAQLVRHDQKLGLREHEHPARVIEVQVRHHDVLHVLELVAERLDLIVDRALAREFDRQHARDLAPVADGIVDHLRMAAGVEEHEAFRVLDQVRGTRHGHQRFVGAVHQERARHGQLRPGERPHAFHLRFGHGIPPCLKGTFRFFADENLNVPF